MVEDLSVTRASDVASTSVHGDAAVTVIVRTLLLPPAADAEAVVARLLAAAPPDERWAMIVIDDASEPMSAEPADSRVTYVRRERSAVHSE